MPWARASALDRHLNCSAASWLPRFDRGSWKPGYLVAADTLVHGPPGEDDSVLAEWGTQMHLAKEGSPDAADPWLSWMDPHRERLWPGGLGVHEQAWRYDCRTGLVELAPPGLTHDEKNAWKSAGGPSTVSGETDWHAQLPSGEPWVDDLKTGYPKPPVTTPQMLMYALVASKVFEYATVRISVTHWRRGWDDPDRYWQQVGPATLDAFEDELRDAWLRTMKDPSPRAGVHCRYCPSAAVCPTVIGEQGTDVE
jgi:hypothetical protein